MAIIHSCCWWNDVTYGSYGSAVYSFLLGGIFTILVVYDVEPFHFFGQTIGENYATIVVGSYLQIVSGFALCLSACSLAVGVFHAIRQLLLPWMISMFLFTLVLFVGNLGLLVRQPLGSAEHGGADALVIIVSMVFCVLNASVSYFRRGSYDTNNAWNQHSITVAEAGGPSTSSIQVLAHAARESMKSKTAIVPSPPRPPSTEEPAAVQYASTSKQALSKLIPTSPKIFNFFNTTKQVRIDTPEKMPTTQDKFIQINHV